MKLRFLFLLLPFLIASCAQQPNKIDHQQLPWLEHREQLIELTDWSLSGKLGLITPENRHSLNIHWQQTEDTFHITLTTFLGLQVLDIQQTEQGTLITDGDGEQYISDDAETLIASLLGWTLPVKLLQQWIKANPEKASYQLNARQLVSSLQSNDEIEPWVIDYNAYKQIENTQLPHNISLKRKDLQIKFAISNWKIEHE